MGNRSSQQQQNKLKEKSKSPVGTIMTSCPPSLAVRSLSYEVDRNSALHHLPEEIFLQIMRLVDPMDLISRCRLVCKYWLDTIDDDKFWRKKCQEACVPFPQIDDSHDNLSLNIDYRCIFLKRPFHRNLVRNWNASDGWNHWEVLENGGNGFAVEPDECYYSNPISSIGVPGCSNCWATSYNWCKKTQTIDLLAEGCTRLILDQLKPTIEISEWTAARYDCASQYLLRVKLQSSTRKTLDVFESERFVGQWEDKSWIKVTHKFCNYPTDLQFVTIEHGGKDRQLWAGHYGPKITASHVMIRLDNCHLCQSQ